MHSIHNGHVRPQHDPTRRTRASLTYLGSLNLTQDHRQRELLMLTVRGLPFCRARDSK